MSEYTRSQMFATISVTELVDGRFEITVEDPFNRRKPIVRVELGEGESALPRIQRELYDFLESEIPAYHRRHRRNTEVTA